MKPDRTRYDLLSAGDKNTKLRKGADSDYVTNGLSFAPGSISGFNVCSSASTGCLAACLHTAGNGRYPNVEAGRIRRTQLFFTDRPLFLSYLRSDLEKSRQRAASLGKRLAIRLNVISDIQYERFFPGLFEEFSDCQFYDYTKHALRMRRFCAGELPDNYHLTFSRSENNWRACVGLLFLGANVASVFEVDRMPARHHGFEVIDGDRTDLRFLEGKRGQIVGLKAKGMARGDTSGFVVHHTESAHSLLDSLA